VENLLNYHKLRLLYSRDKLILNEGFESVDGWEITDDWHVMTVDTNEDKSSGLNGDIAINSAGSFWGGIMEKEIELSNYAEILFEHYVKNENVEDSANKLTFSVDGVKKLEIIGPSPWQRCIPIGLTPGKHTIRFEYVFEGEDPAHKKGVIDTVMVWQAKGVNCLVTEYTPPKPSKNVGSINVLRGFTRFQEMSVADTEINFTAVFEGLSFLEFMQKSDEPFYFVDEFGICYRGIFPESIDPKNIAMNQVYSVELTMIAGQKTGFGFC